MSERLDPVAIDRILESLSRIEERLARIEVARVEPTLEGMSAQAGRLIALARKDPAAAKEAALAYAKEHRGRN